MGLLALRPSMRVSDMTDIFPIAEKVAPRLLDSKRLSLFLLDHLIQLG